MFIKYLKVIEETPILNSENFSYTFRKRDLKTLKVDQRDHIREIEFIALRDMIFQMLKKCESPFIYKVKCDFYKNSDLYIDSRFTTFVNNNPSKKTNYCISKKNILQRLKERLGSKYIWGGNFSNGISKLIDYYPPKDKLNNDQKNHWILKGVDCSGLLFEVTNGFTPRNTCDLLHYKESLKIKNLSPLEIKNIVKPLDLIVFKGHVVIVLDKNFTIESRENYGVIKTSILDRLHEIHHTKNPANGYLTPQDYVIRRWV